MYVYGDILFLVNTIMNALILVLTAWAANLRRQTWRLLAAAGLGGVYAIGALFAADALLYAPAAKLAAAAAIVRLAFGPQTWRSLLLHTAYFYIVSLLLGGAVLGWLLAADNAAGLSAWRQASWRHLAAGAVLGLLLVGVVWRRLAAAASRRPLLVPVVVAYRGRETRMTALLDTGNDLYSPVTRRPVVVAEHRSLETLLAGPVNDWLRRTPPDAWLTELADCPDADWLTRVQAIPCRGVGGAGLLLGFRPDVFAVDSPAGTRAAEAVIAIHSGALSAAGTYAALLHPAIFRKLDEKEGADKCA